MTNSIEVIEIKDNNIHEQCTACLKLQNEMKRIRTSAELVDILDSYLKEKKISRRQFCNLIDVPNSTIASWKSKNVMPSVEIVVKVARFMNVSLDWLVYEDNFYEK